MKFRAQSPANHPQPELLALYTRGDMPAIARFRLKKHLHECAECEANVERFAASITELKREASAQTLTAYEAIADWNSLEREMLGNIVVGVAAARCIEKVGRKRSWFPKVAFTACLSALFVAGWITHIPSSQTSRVVSSILGFAGLHAPSHLGNTVHTTANGIAVRADGVTLTILHPPSAVVSMSGASSVEARYIDEDTGQLTITNVYGQ